MPSTSEIHCPTALVLIDVINDLSFEGGAELLAPALRSAERLVQLRQRAHCANAPIVYVNDNFGNWRSDFRATVARALSPKSRGRPIAEMLRPEESHYFVLKPQHSGFYSTPLELLLRSLKVKRLVLGGFQTHMCVLFTAADAHMRGFELLLPDDCSAAVMRADHESALSIARQCFDADVRPSDEMSDPDLNGVTGPSGH